jgi:hypothetical protein
VFAIVRNQDRSHVRSAEPQYLGEANLSTYRGLFDGLTDESLGALLAAGPAPTANRAQLVVNEPCCLVCGTPASSGACTCDEPTRNGAPVGACSIEDGCGLNSWDGDPDFDIDAVITNELAAGLYERLFGTGGAPGDDDGPTANLEGDDPLPLPLASAAEYRRAGQPQPTATAGPEGTRAVYVGNDPLESV